MAVSYFQFVFVTFLLSCVSVGLIVAAFSTENWVNSELVILGDASIASKINYGLFRGTLTISLLGERINTIYMTCNYGENVCAHSCEDTSEKRQQEIKSLLDKTYVERICGTSTENLDQTKELEWLNSGIYLSVLIFLGIAGLFGILTALLGVYNTSRIAVEPLLGIFGLYIWHGLSILCGLLVLLLWGVNFSINLKNRLGVTYTMLFDINIIWASVGYSYWFVLGSILCHIVSEILLICRWWMIKSTPPPPTISVDNNTDNTIFLY